MKNFYFLIVFILGIIFGIGCVILVQKYFLQDENLLAAKEIVLKMQPQTNVDEVDVKNIPLLKENAVDNQTVIDKPAEPKAEKKSHTFFAMFSSLAVLCLIISVSYGINAKHSDQTKLASAFFGIASLASAIVAFLCY